MTNHRHLLAAIAGTITEIRHHGTCAQVRVHTGAAIDLPLEDIQDLVRAARRDPRGCRPRYASQRLLLFPASPGGRRMSRREEPGTWRRGLDREPAVRIKTSPGGCLILTLACIHTDGTVYGAEQVFPSIEAWLDSLTPEDVGTFEYITFEGPDLEPYEWVIERITQLRRQRNGNDFPGPFIEPPGRQARDGIPVPRR